MIDFKANPRLVERYTSPISSKAEARNKSPFYRWNQDILKVNGLNPNDLPPFPATYVDPKPATSLLSVEEVRELFNDSHHFLANGLYLRWNYVKFLADAEAKYGRLYCKASIPKTITLSELVAGKSKEHPVYLSAIPIMDATDKPLIKVLQDAIKNNPEAFEQYKESFA